MNKNRNIERAVIICVIGLFFLIICFLEYKEINVSDHNTSIVYNTIEEELAELNGFFGRYGYSIQRIPEYESVAPPKEGNLPQAVYYLSENNSENIKQGCACYFYVSKEDAIVGVSKLNEHYYLVSNTVFYVSPDNEVYIEMIAEAQKYFE